MAVSLACDIGGTFTDLVVADNGRLKLFKASTTPKDPAEGLLAALELAAADAGLDRRAFLATADSLMHATTRGINAILTGTAARTAFVVTEGHRDILLLREGGRLNPYDNSVNFPKPYVPRALTFEVSERIGAGGEVVKPLDEESLGQMIDRIAAAKVEAVGVCLLWSIANPVHEEQVAAAIQKRLPDVAVTLSHRLNPIVREYRRASAACIDASLKPLMGRYLRDLAVRLKDAGFAGRLLMVTSQGGVIDAQAAADAPIHTLNSGPSMAPLAGRHFAQADAAGADAIVADTGGTSYDVSLVRDGRVPWTSETWLGARFTGHMTGFPSVDVKSIGAGGGSIARVDSGGLLHVGPESAGAMPGPICYGAGGTRVTVTDCALVLGYLDETRFLGGRMALNGDAAREAIEAQIAKPLGVSIEEAALAVLDLLTQNMVAAIEEITVKQGIDPARAVLIAGGGAAGFNSGAIARRLGCKGTLLPQTGAALSAAGAMLSDLIFTDSRVKYLRSDSPDPAAVSATLSELAASAKSFAAQSKGTSTVEYWVEARYPQQTWEIEVPIPSMGFDAKIDLLKLVENFHAAHKALYAVSDPTSPIEIITWRMRTSIRLRDEPDTRLDRGAGEGAARRRIYVRGGGWTEAPLHRFATVSDAKPVAGPAIIETPFTTIVVPPDMAARRLPSGSIELRQEAR